MKLREREAPNKLSLGCTQYKATTIVSCSTTSRGKFQRLSWGLDGGEHTRGRRRVSVDVRPGSRAGYPAIYIAASSNIDSSLARAASSESTSSAVGRDPREAVSSSSSFPSDQRSLLLRGLETSRSVSLLVCSAQRVKEYTQTYTHTRTRSPGT